MKQVCTWTEPVFQLLDVTDETAVLVDVDGVVVMINRIGAQRVGRAREEVIGRHLDELLPRELARFRLGIYREVIRSGRATRYTDSRDGQWFENHVWPVADPRGEVSYAGVFARDVTVRRRLELDRLARTRELETIHDHAPVAMMLVDPDRRVVKVNRAIVGMIGRPESEIIWRRGGEAVGCLNALDDERGCGQGAACRDCGLRLAVKAAFEEGEVAHGVPVSLPLPGEEGTLNQELVVSVAPLEIDGHPRVLVCLQDVSGLRRAEEALALKAMALDQISDRVLITDLAGRILDVNEAYCRVRNATRDQLVGRSLLSFDAEPSGGPSRAEVMAHTLEHGRWQGEMQHVDGAGRPRMLDVRTNVVHDREGRPVALSAVASDITEHREQEAQLRQAQKMEALGRLAAGVAHDFNNQLTVISGYVDMLLGEIGTDHPHRPSLQQIRRAAERSAATTSHLLAFGRRQELDPRQLDLNELIRDLHHPVDKMIGETIALVVEASPRLGLVRADRSALQQALFNLIINARDAMPGGGRITLRTANRSLERAGTSVPAVAVEVVDDGRGIAPEHLDRVCEPFFTTKATGEGTGLGLAMVRGFVEQSGGRLAIESEPGAGTTVTILLPAMTSAEPAAEERETATAGRRLAGRILVVEDAEPVRELVVGILRRAGAEVQAAAGPAEAMALAAADAVPYDLLVSDLVMPEMGGKQLAEELDRRGRIRGAIFMSGYCPDPADRPASPVLQKPFDASELVNLAADALLVTAGLTEVSS